MAHCCKCLSSTVDKAWEDGVSFSNFCLGAQTSKLKTAYSNFARNNSYTLTKLNLTVSLGSFTYIST